MAEVRRWAHIKNGVVENVSNWDGDTWRWTPPEDVEMLPAPDHVGRDWRYENGEWLPPIVVEQPPQEEIPTEESVPANT